MSEVKHTPLPWRVADDGIVMFTRTGAWKYAMPVPLASGFVEDAYCGEYATTESRANARLIVQAVNSHGDLVEALRTARDHLEYLQTCVSRDEITPAVIAQIDTALSKVLELGEGL